MPRAHASQVAEAALGPLLSEYAPSLTTIYLETIADSRWLAYAVDALPDSVVRGRAFGAQCDVQFWRHGDGFRVRILTDLPRPAANGDSIDLAGYDVEVVTYALWGQYDAASGRWRERGAARGYAYPLAGTPNRVGVEAREYRERNSGDLHFVRYHRLVAFDDSEAAS